MNENKPLTVSAIRHLMFRFDAQEEKAAAILVVAPEADVTAVVLRLPGESPEDAFSRWIQAEAADNLAAKDDPDNTLEEEMEYLAELCDWSEIEIY